MPRDHRPGRPPRAVAGRGRGAVVGLAAIAALSLLLARPSAMAATLSPQEQVETRLMCYCGCADLTVRACSCGTAAMIKNDIAQRLADGQTADQVVQAYVKEHGEQIRSAPTTEGFNLLAWITPFAAILAGGALIVSLTRRWRHRPASGPDAMGRAPGPVPDAERLTREERDTLQRIEREIREEL